MNVNVNLGCGPLGLLPGYAGWLGAMVKDQIVPLKDGDYYIKLYFENKLIGITKFNYYVIKKKL